MFGYKYGIVTNFKINKASMKSGQNPSHDSWDYLKSAVLETKTGAFLKEQELLRSTGEGLPHTDAKVRLFGTKAEPRVTLFRDTAAWCPYCQV